jgi:hypothetical protein
MTRGVQARVSVTDSNRLSADSGGSLNKHLLSVQDVVPLSCTDELQYMPK